MNEPVPAHSELDANLAVKSYFQDPDWMFKTGIGGTITAASIVLSIMDPVHFMLFPISLALAGVSTGYVLRTIRQRLSEPEKPLPKWDDWGDLFMSGITWIAVQFGISVLAATVITIVIMVCYATVVKSSAFVTPMLEAGLFCILATVFWTHFISTFLMVNFAKEEKLGAGFAVIPVLRRIRKNSPLFLLTWALATAIQVFSVLVSAITILGIFIIPSVYFASQLVAASLLAQAWRSVPDQMAESAPAAAIK